MNNTSQQLEYDSEFPDNSGNPATTVAPRNPIFAALMSAILPGFGQLYNGQLNKSIWIFLSFCLLSVPVILIIALYLPINLTLVLVAISTLITLLVWLYGIIDGWRSARRLGNYQLKPWQTSGTYAVVFLVCCMLILPTIIFWVRDNQVQAFRTPSGSMSPTVLPGDMIFADMWYNCPLCRTAVSRGDVAIFIFPNDRSHHYIKRVVGLPGDVVNVSSAGVSVNGVALGQRASSHTESINNKSWQVIWDIQEDVQNFEATVAPGHAFVLGDNRSKSNDSRFFGQVPLSDIKGLARQVWYSKGSDGIRWSRIGTSLQPSTQEK